jgi:DNA-binding NtrC family response regulator
MAHALIVDDDDNTRAALAEIISAEGMTVAHARDLRAARIQLIRQTPDLIFTDLRLPDGEGVELLGELDATAGVDVIVITGHATVESAVNAMTHGAIDYLVKPVNLPRVRAIVSRIPRKGDLKAEVESLRSELRRFGRFGEMMGNSAPMQQLYDHISKIAPTAASVLLIGESGTGKELAARTVHALSLRRKRPFLAVNCGAISPTLIESEMFGHERGAFTGADRVHKGYFERANGGTLFLDEITEMPIALQVKLLRVLETGAFMRVGSNREIETDVRVIAATNRDPEEAVFEGKLRTDLYHRLNVFPLVLPPLRERGNDVELIARGFVEQLNVQYETHKRISDELMAVWRSQAWPGNVRELKNAVQRAHILSPGDLIGCETQHAGTSASARSASQRHTAAAITVAVGTSLMDANRELIYATLGQCGGVKTHAAEILGISLKTLYNRLAQYEAQTDGAVAPAGDPNARENDAAESESLDAESDRAG